MKNLFLFVLFFVLSLSIQSQTLLSTDFTGTFPPAGWTVDAHSTNWSAVPSGNAGGAGPEARFYYSPSFTDQSRLISPPINTTGMTRLRLEFRHKLVHYTTPYTIGVATRKGAGAWNVVWSKVSPNASIGPVQEYVIINNSDLGSSDFQVCWFFDGYSYNLDYWYIDDIKLVVAKDHDVLAKSIIVNDQYVPGTAVTPMVVVRNFGTVSETVNVTAGISINNQSVYNNTSSNLSIAPNEEATFTLADYTASAPNELFEISAKANLTGDQDTANNRLTRFFNTYTSPRDHVILEIGTGTWCQYCPGASMGAHDLITNGKTVGVVKNHNGDSFTNAFSNARNSYYGISGYPTAVFDGTTQYVGGSNTVSMYPQYLPIYEAKKLINSAYTIQPFGTHNGTDYTLQVIINKLARVPASNSLVLHAALTESDISFSWQGQTIVNNAMRIMMPNELGTSLDFGTASTLTVPITFSMNASWITHNCELVFWIQNKDTKEIYQGTKIMVSNLTPTPVELTSFTAAASPKGITLNWVTATELNNRGFEIQRSKDGINFFTLAFIKGAGNSTESRSYVYNDILEKGKRENFTYRLKQSDFNGNISYSKPVQVEYNFPVVFSLQQNYPNPFNPSTVINFSIPKQEFVSLKVYDVLGNEVAQLVNEMKETGSYDVHFNAAGYASGIYYYKISAGTFNAVRKMIVIK